MTPEQITAIASVLMADIERFPEARRIHAGEFDGYKPFYRGVSCAIDLVREAHQQLATKEEVEAMLRQAHPWYGKALDGEFNDKFTDWDIQIGSDKKKDGSPAPWDNRGTFDHLYQFHAEIYSEPD
jgi:hypothetical protein